MPKLALLRRKVIWIPTALMVLWTVSGFFVLPHVVRSLLPEKLGAALNRPVTVGDVTFNPYSLDLVVRELSVTERKGEPFVRFHSLELNASLFALIRGRIGFDLIALDGPQVSVTLNQDGSLSFADLLESGSRESNESSADPVTVSIAALKVTDGVFTFHDLTRAEPFSAQLQPLALDLTDFTTEAGHGSRYTFQAKLGQAQIDYEGELSSRPLRSNGRLSMQGLRLDALQPYVASATQLEVLGGTLGVSGRYQLDGTAQPLSFVLEDCHVDVNGLSIGGAGETEPLFELGTLSAVASRLDLVKKEGQFSEIVLGQGTLNARREKDGQVQLWRLARSKNPNRVPTPIAAKSEGPTWSVKLNRFALDDWRLQWADESLEYPVKLGVDQLKLDVRNITWPPKRPLDASLAFRWQQSGQVRLSGPVTVEPPGADLEVSLEGVQLKAFDGYAWAGGFNGTLAQATLGANLKAHVGNAGEELAVAGTVGLSDVSLLDGEERPLLTLRTLALKGLNYRTSPLPVVSLETAQVSGINLKLERDEKGRVNLSQLVRETPSSGPQEAKPSSRALTAAIHEVLFDHVDVHWLDKQTVPAFSSATTRLAGRFTKLTSPVRGPIGINVTGQVDQAPTSVTGSLLPKADAFAADLKFSIEGYDLPHAAPYAVKYVAQPINVGKLVIGLDAKVSAKKIDATTHVVVDQLEFGDRVPEPGPDAKSLPLGLAVAVLSDRNGRIDLSLPISGDMSKPDFKWGGVVWQVLFSLMEKVVTSPFSLLSGLMSGADPEVLKLIAFAPGSSVATGDEAKKLDVLAKLLADRPKLSLELTPGADQIADRDALAHQAMLRMLIAKAEKSSGVRLAADGGNPTLAPGQYEQLVSAEWAKRAGADAGVVKTFAEKEADLLASHPVQLEDLSALGRDRAAWCQSALQDRGVPVTRVFVVQTADGKGTRAQVDIGLR